MESGGIEVARTPERMQEFHRRLQSARAFGIDHSSLLTPEEIKAIVPYIDETIILGGFQTTSAGVVDSLRMGTLMREDAIEKGALTVSANTEVLDIVVEDDRIKSVVTDNGEIECDYVVIATGCWGPKLAAMAGTSIPLTPAVHQIKDHLLGFVSLSAAAYDLTSLHIVFVCVRIHNHSQFLVYDNKHVCMPYNLICMMHHTNHIYVPILAFHMHVCTCVGWDSCYVCVSPT